MFSPTFDWVFAAILAVLAVVFFMGKGAGVLRAFSGRDNEMMVKKKTEAGGRTPLSTGIWLVPSDHGRQRGDDGDSGAVFLLGAHRVHRNYSCGSGGAGALSQKKIP